MFAVGDNVVYGTMGVCKIQDICEMEIPGAARECYLLIPEYIPNAKIYAPTQNNPVEMRKLLSPKQAQMLIQRLPEIEPFPMLTEKRELYELSKSAIKSTDTVEIARLIKTFYGRKKEVEKNNKTVPIAEKEFYDKAEMILYGEIASVLGMPLKDVQSCVTDSIESV